MSGGPRGLITITQEHLATDLVRRHGRPAGALPLACGQRPQRVVGTVQPEQHELGARMVADLGPWTGGTYMLTNVPPGEFAAHAATLAPDLVVLSVVLDANRSRHAGDHRAAARLPGCPSWWEAPPDGRGCRRGRSGCSRGAAARTSPGRRPGRGAPAGGVAAPGRSAGAGRAARARLEPAVAGRGLGVDRAYLSGLENGRQNPTLGILLRVAEALEVSVETLMQAR